VPLLPSPEIHDQSFHVKEPKNADRRTGRLKDRKVGALVLEREEWFFGKVPDDEVLTCYYYEYARSRPDIHAIVYLWRKRFKRWGQESKPSEKAIEAFRRDLMRLTDSTCSQLLVNLYEFPDTPWQRINASRRKQWKTLLNFYPHLDSIRGGVRLGSTKTR